MLLYRLNEMNTCVLSPSNLFEYEETSEQRIRTIPAVNESFITTTTRNTLVI